VVFVAVPPSPVVVAAPGAGMVYVVVVTVVPPPPAAGAVVTDVPGITVAVATGIWLPLVPSLPSIGGAVGGTLKPISPSSFAEIVVAVTTGMLLSPDG